METDALRDADRRRYQDADQVAFAKVVGDLKQDTDGLHACEPVVTLPGTG